MRASRVKPLAARFWPKVDKRGPEECWEWQAATNGVGYGRMGRGRRGEGWIYAHRVSWELAHGPILNDLWVLHKCDNPACVNPAHLFLGTQVENMADCASKGRIRHGPQHEWTRLSVSDVRAIRASTAKRSEIAAKFQLTPEYVSRIRNNHVWTTVC